MKMLFQQLWQTNHEWDQEIPPEARTLHLKWRNELHLLSSQVLPRCYSPPQLDSITQELHGFCDASQKGYGAVVYCRTTHHNHPPTISLVTAKTKVARIKPLTIPRLELCGATLLTQLLITTSKALNISLDNCHAWSDSTIVLSWLDGNPHSYKVYVANRVNYILENTSPRIWLHVPTDQNPADCASRGMMPEDLSQHRLWWEGPEWLHSQPYKIPKQPGKEEVEFPELKRLHIMVRTSTIPAQLCARFSNYFTIIAVAGWIWRFVDKLLKRKLSPAREGKHLTGPEVRDAEHWLMKQSQITSFPAERTSLLKDSNMPASSRLLALHPFLDSEGLLRVGGRLTHSALSKSQQHPIILDSKDLLTRKYFNYMHLALCHCGPTLLLSATSTKVHVVGARKLSRAICSQCITCRKYNPRPQPQLMADLPAARVTPARAFSHTGMDLAGPFTIKMGHVRRPTNLKAHLCIFICLTYKAVHLEVLSETTTEAFLAAFQRFTARRGCPAHLYSDNGPNFVGASNQLKELYNLLEKSTDPSIQHYLMEHYRVSWNHIPPRSPHFGGLWESAVKSAKKHLKRVMGDLRFTFEELETVACQIEACLNSRPLIPTTSHNQDGLATLTAGHFLLHHQPSVYPEDPRIPKEPHLLKQWNLCQSVVYHFWTRWSREYLNTLQSRTKWQRESPNLQPGDIIILKPEKTFARHRPLGKITEVYPGADDRVRVAMVKTTAGIYKRPVVKMSLLFRPGDGTSQEQERPQEASASSPPPVCSGTAFQWRPEQGQHREQIKETTPSRAAGICLHGLPTTRLIITLTSISLAS